MALYYYQVWILQRVNQILRLALLDRLQSALAALPRRQRASATRIYRMYQDSAMVTQLIEVLFLAPIYTIARYRASASARWRSSTRCSRCCSRCSGRRSSCIGVWFSQRAARSASARAREADSALTVEHPGDARRASA